MDRDKLLPELKSAEIQSTWMQRIPGIMSKFKLYFWLYPFAINTIDLTDYDLVISSSSAYAKGIKKPSHVVHLCYCHTPMRFAWNFDSYMEGMSVPKCLKKVARFFTYPLKKWDLANSHKVDQLIANSTVVRSRIKEFYGMDSQIIFPPVDITRFSINREGTDDYYLVVSRLVSYKRLDLAIKACSKAGKNLVVIGDGPDRNRLEAMAGPSVKFMGRLSDREVVCYMQRCKAFLFPGLEDFGITPLEINACGRPVVAFRGGGALDTIRPGVNGVFFEEPTVESLLKGIQALETCEWDPQIIRKHAETFNETVFMEKLHTIITYVLQKKNAKREGLDEGRSIVRGLR